MNDYACLYVSSACLKLKLTNIQSAEIVKSTFVLHCT